MKIAWVCSYPIESLQNQGLVLQRSRPEHPCSWIVNLSRALAEHPDVELHLFMETQFVSKDQVIHAEEMLAVPSDAGGPIGADDLESELMRPLV